MILEKVQLADVSADHGVKDAAGDVHWVDKSEAARELEVSLSTLDRMIRKAELEVKRQGRRVYVKLPGPRYPSDRELLRQARTQIERLERVVDELVGEANQLERERDRDRAETESVKAENGRLEGLYRAERLARGRMRRLAGRLGVAVAVLLALLVISGVVTWLVAT